MNDKERIDQLSELMKKTDERIVDLKRELKDALDDLEAGDCVGWRNRMSMREQLEIEDESLEDQVKAILEEEQPMVTDSSTIEDMTETKMGDISDIDAECIAICIEHLSECIGAKPHDTLEVLINTHLIPSEHSCEVAIYLNDIAT